MIAIHDYYYLNTGFNLPKTRYENKQLLIALFSGMDQVAQLKTCSFDLINFNGCLIPHKEQSVINAYKDILWRFDMPFPCSLNALVAQYLLLSTDHWGATNQVLSDQSLIKSKIDLISDMLKLERIDFEARLKQLPSTLEDMDQCLRLHDPKKASIIEEVAKAKQESLYSMQMGGIMKSYAKTDYEMSPDHFSGQNLIAGHLGPLWSANHTESFCKTVQQIPVFVSKFARKSAYFLSLTENDKSLLMEKNSGLIAQYHIARYCGASNGLDQLIWILGSHLPHLCTYYYLVNS